MRRVLLSQLEFHDNQKNYCTLTEHMVKISRLLTILNMINISHQKQLILVYIILTLAALVVFWQVNQYDFINFDDNVYVTENSHVLSGITLDGLRWAFKTTDAQFWHPLTWLSLMLDNQIHGLNAGGYHLTNLILHILSTLLLFWLFNRMTGAIWKSAFVAALFALHPLHVETVTWIAKRKDVLSAFFWMLTLCLYVYYTEKVSIRRYLLVLFPFACALMSKSMVVTLPVIMIILDYWPLSRLQSRQGNSILWQLREKIPFFILSAVFSIITIYVRYNWENPFLSNFPMRSRFVNAPVSFINYLGKIFWPRDMAVFYPFSGQIPAWQVIGSTLLIIVISTVVIIAVKRFPYLFVGWLWYAVTILPVIGIIQVGIRAVSDNYTYLPSIGIAVMLAWGIPLLFPSEKIRRKILFPAGIAAIVILAILTWQQCGYWKNSIELLKHTLVVTKSNALAHGCLAYALEDEGNIEEAIIHYNKVIDLKYDSAGDYSNRANAYAKLGQYQRAIEDYNKAISIKPNMPTLYYNRATAYVEFGQYQSAIADFNKAISMKHDYALAYYGRGIVYLRQGDNKLGCRDAQKACELGNCRLLEFAKDQGHCR